MLHHTVLLYFLSILMLDMRYEIAYGMISPPRLSGEWVLAAFSRASFLRPVMYTRAPFAASACVAISPIPVAPPVTTQTKPLTEKSFSDLRFSVDDILAINSYLTVNSTSVVLRDNYRTRFTSSRVASYHVFQYHVVTCGIRAGKLFCFCRMTRI